MDGKDLSFLSLYEAAEILHVSSRTVLRLIQKQKLPALKVGGQWRIRENQLKVWVEQRENKTLKS